MKKKQLLFFTPGMLFLILLLVIPLIMLIIKSITLNGVPSLDNYKTLFSNSVFKVALKNTLRIGLKVTLITLLIGIPTSYFISRVSGKLKGLLIALTIFPLLVNAVIRSLSWMIILGRNGVVNKFLLFIKLIDQPLDILYTETSILIGSVYIFLPLMIITLVGVMDNIPSDLEEAALSLGAPKTSIFTKIILPLSIQGIVVGSILVFTATTTAYTTPQLLGGDNTLVLATLIRQYGLDRGEWGMVSSISFIMFTITLLITFSLNYLSNKVAGEDEYEV